MWDKLDSSWGSLSQALVNLYLPAGGAKHSFSLPLPSRPEECFILNRLKVVLHEGLTAMINVRICTIYEEFGTEPRILSCRQFCFCFSPPTLQSVSNLVHSLFSYHLIHGKYIYIFYWTYQVFLVIEILFYV